MELLAPAGTKENFMAALDAGADAIYLGGKIFNARANANNFTLEELEEAVHLAHVLGVAIYVTVNILISDKEMPALVDYIKALDRIGVDAVIVQDIAVAKLVRTLSKRLAIHASTQMTATNLATVEYLRKIGFSRVVLSRELSLEEIEYICKNTSAEIEVFIHGALCVCYSGQCLMSSFIGGRSGNRGACAQPCRLPYELVDEQGISQLPKEQSYLLSPKDLNYAEYMDKLIAAGVTSFKVEGRMKKVSYVREVIGTYRKIIDAQGHAGAQELERLTKGFNRGFAQHYLLGKSGKDMMTILAPNNQGQLIGTANRKGKQLVVQTGRKLAQGDLLKIVENEADSLYITVDDSWNFQNDRYVCTPESMSVRQGKVYLVASKAKEEEHSSLAYFTRKIPLYAYLDGEEGRPVSLTLLTEEGDTVTIEDEYVLAVAHSNPTTAEKVTAQLQRLGNTLFSLQSVSMPQGNFLWPASVLNRLRRNAIEALEDVRLRRYESMHTKEQKEWTLPYAFAPLSLSGRHVSVRVDEWEGVVAAIEGGATIVHFGGDRLQRVPYDMSIYKKVVTYCHNHDVLCVITTPRIVKASEEKAYLPTLAHIIASKPDAIGIHFLGALEWLSQCGYTGSVWGDSSLNIFNAASVGFLMEQGITTIMVSEEATLGQIKKIAESVSSKGKNNAGVHLEGLVQGETELMVSEYCAIGSFIGQGDKKTCPRPCVKGAYYLKDRKGELFRLRTDPYCRMHIMNGKELSMAPYVTEILDKGLRVLRIEGRQRSPEYIKKELEEYRYLMAHPEVKLSKEGKEITRGHYFKGIF